MSDVGETITKTRDDTVDIRELSVLAGLGDPFVHFPFMITLLPGRGPCHNGSAASQSYLEVHG